jgi:branched-chain amino acid transport system substrate-binding protein
MDDPNDPLARALREDPLPDRPYPHGTFADRLRRGELARVGTSPVAPGRPMARLGTTRAVGLVAVVIAVVGGLLTLRGGVGLLTSGSTPSPSAPPTVAPAASPSPSPSLPAPLGSILRIGISLPLSIDVTQPADALRDGALLAIADANARHLIPGVTIEPVVLDHASPGNNDLAHAVADMHSLVADPTVVGVVGPFTSSVAQGQIPVANAAGLLECSPSASSPDLTKGPTAQQLRAANPDRITFLRLAPTDDLVGPALADFAIHTLHAGRAFVVDDGAAYGSALAASFAARFTTDGGIIVGRRSTAVGDTDYSAVLQAGVEAHPDVVLFGGVNAFGGDGASGAGAFRRQMAAAGLGAVPLVGGDGLKDLDQSGRSLITIAGSAAAGTYSADLVPPAYPGEAAFATAFRAAYGRVPGPYAGPGYACAQVILQALATAATRGQVDREAVRAAGADSAATFDTILGAIRFDAAGDLTTPTIGIDGIDPKANGGAGAWVPLVPGTLGP